MVGLWWWLFKPKKQASQTPEVPPQPKPAAQTTAPDETLKMPPTKEVLTTFARDLSAGTPEIMAFAEAMMRDGKIQQTYDAPELRVFNEFVNESDSGPEHFATTLISASVEYRVNARPGDPIRERLHYVDWKEDVPELMAGFEEMLAPTGVKSGIDPRIFEDEALLPFYKDYKAPPIVSAHYRPVFVKAGLTLLEVVPQGGWDAYLFMALPHKYAKRWNLTSLRARRDSPKKTEVWAWDAYFVGEGYVRAAQPEGIKVFEKNPDRKLFIKRYWED